MPGGRFNPWAALRARPHLTFEYRFITCRGLWTPHGDGTATITLDPRLTRRERRCVLTHELVHDERGIPFPAGAPRALVEAEERWVRAETVRRLVPPDQLAALVERAPGPLTVVDVADEFDVDWRTARAACARIG